VGSDNEPADAYTNKVARERPIYVCQVRIDPRPISAIHRGAPHVTVNLDIKDLLLDDLLAATVDRTTTPATIIDTWIIAEGYYPGQTRIAASELLDRFRKWAISQGVTTPMNHNTFGEDMRRRFKVGRRRAGVFYYISRESVVDIYPPVK